MEIPGGLDWLRASDEGRRWLDSLPALLAGAVERWSLQVGPPYPYAYASVAMPVVLPGRREAVLKIAFPDRESEHEAAALAAWGGNGAVRLLDHDEASLALLLERCVPGTPLAAVGPAAALEVLAGLLPRLWVPAGAPFRPLADEAARWASDLEAKWHGAGRPFERAVLDAALDALRSLPPSQGEQVLVHQDLHAGNVLRAEREPWLVIDPKPLVGEREFGLAPIVRGPELGHGEAGVVARLDELCTVLHLDRERARRWALAHTVAWAFDGAGAIRSHVEVARWLLHAG